MSLLKFAALAHMVWRESRTPFLVVALIVFLNCWFGIDRVYQQIQEGSESRNIPMVNLFMGTYRVWGLAFAYLGAGSLHWEARQGGRDFTMTLPLCGFHMNLIRGSVGVFHVIALVFLPGITAMTAHGLLRPDFDVPVAPMVGCYGVGAGVMVYGLSMLVSVFVPNTYVATVCGYLSFSLVDRGFRAFPALKLFTPINALIYLGGKGPASFPWPPFWVHLLVGLAAMTLAAYLAERRRMLST